MMRVDEGLVMRVDEGVMMRLHEGGSRECNDRVELPDKIETADKFANRDF